MEVYRTDLARLRRNQRGVGTGKLAAKGAKAEIGLSPAKTQRRKGKKNKTPNLASLRLGGSNSPFLRGKGWPDNLREPRKCLRIAVHAFLQTALGKRGSPVGEQPRNQRR
jgi:hypothetical protein